MSVKGKIVTDMIRFFTSQKMLGPKIQDGTLRKNLVEPPWHCPDEYLNLPIHMRQFEMELLTPKAADNGEVVLQLHGGGYIAKIYSVVGRGGNRILSWIVFGTYLTLWVMTMILGGRKAENEVRRKFHL